MDILLQFVPRRQWKEIALSPNLFRSICTSLDSCTGLVIILNNCWASWYYHSRSWFSFHNNVYQNYYRCSSVMTGQRMKLYSERAWNKKRKCHRKKVHISLNLTMSCRTGHLISLFRSKKSVTKDFTDQTLRLFVCFDFGVARIWIVHAIFQQCSGRITCILLVKHVNVRTIPCKEFGRGKLLYTFYNQ